MKKINWVLLIAIPLLWAACSKDDVAEAATETTKELTLAERTAGNNPYNVNNMQLAYDYLVQQGRLQPGMFPDFLIRPTHKYVKLKPETLEEEDQINADTTFIALDYPLDIDLPESYFEERGELQEGQIPEYYSSLKINQNIAYSGPTELIEEMYVPEEDPYFENADEDYQPGTEQITTRAQLHDELLFTAYFFKGLEHLLAPDMNAAKGTNIDDDRPQKPVLSNAANTLVLDGNNEKRFNDLIIIKPNWIFGKKWNPSGRLHYTDNSLPPSNVTGRGNQVRFLNGAQVLIRQGFTLHNAVTDANGYFRMGSVRGHARYYIQWERDRYNIRNSGGGQAELAGPHQRSPWEYVISSNDVRQTHYALVHLACLDYYYGDRFQLTQPRNNIRIKLAGGAKDCTSNHVTLRKNFGGSDIILCNLDYDCSKTYGITIHELAHSAHYQFNRPGYNKLVNDGHINPWISMGQTHENPGPTARSARRTLETWASTVELLFVQRRYVISGTSTVGLNRVAEEYRLLRQDYLNDGNAQYYTSCGYDLIDTYNQRTTANPTRHIDRVSGYTAKQLESSLYGATNWNAWRDNIKNQHTNATSGNVDELFANWN